MSYLLTCMSHMDEKRKLLQATTSIKQAKRIQPYPLRGYLLIEFLIGMSLISLMMTSFLIYFQSSVHWLEEVNHQQQMWEDIRFTRALMSHHIERGASQMSIRNGGTTLKMVGGNSLGYRKGSMNIILSDGVPQPITTYDVNPSQGYLWITIGERPFFTAIPGGAIRVTWREDLRLSQPWSDWAAPQSYDAQIVQMPRQIYWYRKSPPRAM